MARTKLQRSVYNFVARRTRPDGKIIGYNARTGTFAALSEATADLLLGGAPVPDSAEMEVLVEMGFLHRGDEESRIAARWSGQAVNSTALGLTIVPTMECNRRCPYCYQAPARPAGHMSEAVQAAVLRFLQKCFASGISAFQCTWYGGEPLLARETVLDMTWKIDEMAAARLGHPPTMKLITNGTLLDQQTAERLARAGITMAQISFDSYTDDGWFRRGVVSSDGSMGLILRNIVAARTKLKISIRINCSEDNLADVDRIVSMLRAHDLGENFYVARIRGCGCASMAESAGSSPGLQILPPTSRPLNGHGTTGLSAATFARYEQASSIQNQKLVNLINERLVPRSHFCGATTLKFFVIDPDGRISRCWESSGRPEEAIGTVYDDPESLSANEGSTRWSSFDPTRDPTCSRCKVLPLCMGGCPHDRVWGVQTQPECESVRFQIENLVEHVASRLSLPPSEQGAGKCEIHPD